MVINLQRSLLRADLARDLNKIPIRAILGDGNGRLYDNQNPNSGYVWVQQQTSNGFSTGERVRGPYQGAPVQMILGNPVVLKRDTDGQLFVAGPDFQGIVSTGSNPGANNASDENANQWTNQSSIVTLVSHCTAPPSLSIIVRGWMAIQNLTITWFNGGTLDLTSLVPSAGNQRLVTIVLKSDFATLAAYASTAKDSTDVLTVADLQEGLTAAAAADSKAVPIWAWRLHDAQTTITDADSWLDYRQMINLTGVSTTDLSPAVIIAPASSTRNTILPTGDFIDLVLKAVSAQTANLLEGRNNSGTLLFSFDPTGKLGLGNVTPSQLLHVRNDSNDPIAMVEAQGTGLSPELRFSHARTGNANLANGDFAGLVNFYGRFNSTTDTLARIYGFYTGDGTTQKGDLVLQTANSAIPVERMRITSSGQVSINQASPNAAAIFQVDSTTQGDLIPRMTTTQRDAISSPPDGLILYNSTTNLFTVRENSAWREMASLNGTETLTNKTIGNTNTITVKDANFIIQDDGDTSKQAAFQASSISASTTRTYTLPDNNGTLALTSDLDSYVILAPTTSTRNTIQPTSNVIPIVIKGASGQTVPLTRWLDNSGNILASINSAGAITTNAGNVTINGLGASAAVQAQSFGTSVFPYFIGIAARGTVGSPTAVQSGDNLIIFGGRGYPNTGYDAVVIAGKATETFASGTNAGAKLQLIVTPAGTESQRTAVEIQDTGKLNLIAGTQTTNYAAAGGAVFDDFADVNNSTTAETDAYSHTVKGATLAVDGDKLEVEYGGVLVTGATKNHRIRGYFAGSTYFDETATSSAAFDTWSLKATMVRAGATSLRIMTVFTLHNTTVTSSLSWTVYTLLSPTLSNDNTLKITLTASGAGAASSDITAKIGIVKWLSNAG